MAPNQRVQKSGFKPGKGTRIRGSALALGQMTKKLRKSGKGGEGKYFSISYRSKGRRVGLVRD